MVMSREDLFNLINTNFPNNAEELITPTALREVCTQTVDSMALNSRSFAEVELLRAATTVVQEPVSVNVALQVTFGPAQLTAAHPVMLNAQGGLVFNKSGSYIITLGLLKGRTGEGEVSVLRSRVLIDGAQMGPARVDTIPAAGFVSTAASKFVFSAKAGQTMTIQIVRDSAGADDGGLYPMAASPSGWGTTPSAQLVISRLESVR